MEAAKKEGSEPSLFTSFDFVADRQYAQALGEKFLWEPILRYHSSLNRISPLLIFRVKILKEKRQTSRAMLTPSPKELRRVDLQLASTASFSLFFPMVSPSSPTATLLQTHRDILRKIHANRIERSSIVAPSEHKLPDLPPSPSPSPPPSSPEAHPQEQSTLDISHIPEAKRRKYEAYYPTYW